MSAEEGFCDQGAADFHIKVALEKAFRFRSTSFQEVILHTLIIIK
jgi:hypothetical protein